MIDYFNHSVTTTAQSFIHIRATIAEILFPNLAQGHLFSLFPFSQLNNVTKLNVPRLLVSVEIWHHKCSAVSLQLVASWHLNAVQLVTMFTVYTNQRNALKSKHKLWFCFIRVSWSSMDMKSDAQQLNSKVHPSPGALGIILVKGESK